MVNKNSLLAAQVELETGQKTYWIPHIENGKLVSFEDKSSFKSKAKQQGFTEDTLISFYK